MSLNNDMRQNIQSNLDFSPSPTGEARRARREGSESLRTTSVPESPAGTDRTMEEIVERENLKDALRRVKANKGAPGVDAMTVDQLGDYLKQHWPAIREQLLSGTYRPKPVKRVEIPKPDGGVRKLGIPTVLDRFIQQAVMAGTATQMGPDVFRSQLRVSTWALGASGGGGGAEVYRGWLSLGGGSGFGEVLRPGQPRQTDGEDRRT